MTQSSGFNALTPQQHGFLFAILKDSREFLPSRRVFDLCYKRLRNITLEELYDAYRKLNLALCNHEFPFESDALPSWILHVGCTSREVRSMRQILGCFSRLDGFCDSQSALDAYAVRISSSRGRCPDGLLQYARDLVSAWLGPCPVLLDLLPKHGPGAVAEALPDPLQKADFRLIYPQLSPHGGSALLHLHDRHAELEPCTLKSVAHPITRVIAVPKDFRRPRIISCEPLTMQFLQQALCRYMMSTIEARSPYIRFRDQSYNATKARDLSCATLDMSDASDTVSRRIVKQLFPEDWCRLLFALRSHFAKCPNGTIVPLRAFAPMGSALCFPVESVVFAAVTVASLLVSKGSKWVKTNSSRVAIYGDDIIIPCECAHDVLVGLCVSGFTPNKQKCCISGLFRESCGAEWYDGDDVTICRPRTLLPHATTADRLTILGEMPMVSHAKSLYSKGFSSAAQYLADLCKFPVAIGDGPGYSPAYLRWPMAGKLRWNPNLQRLEQQALLPVQIVKPSSADTGYKMLFLHLCSGWQSKQVSIPRVKPKNRWVLAAPLMER